MLDIKELTICDWVYIPSLSMAAYGKKSVLFCIEEIYTEDDEYKVLCHCDTKEGYNLTEDVSLPEIEFIPLTEELLLKCGFTKEYYGFSCDIVELSYGRFLCNDDTDKDKLFLSINNAEYTISGVSLKYLHQLQNIYYDLTGKELDVKL